MDIYCAECIISNKERRGNGTLLSPSRVIRQVYTKDGELLGELDPSPETFALFDLIHFHNYCLESGIKAADAKDVENWVHSLNK